MMYYRERGKVVMKKSGTLVLKIGKEETEGLIERRNIKKNEDLPE